jgi:surface antigen
MEMGERRAGDGALGRAAVIRRLGFCVLLALTACENSAQNSAGPIGGAAVGLGVAGITADPFIAYAAGVGAQAAITALQKYLSRKLHQGEQDNIALAVSRLAPGQEAPWKIHYAIPIDGEHGDVTVLRVIDSPLTVCKQVAFTVIAGKARAVYITSACRESDGTWKWAEAEPAAARWGFLQ